MPVTRTSSVVVRINILCRIRSFLWRVIEAHFHHVKLKVGNAECDVYAGFTFDSIGISGLLGQRGFFDHFRVIFDRSDNSVIINPRTALQKFLTGLGL